MDTCSKNLYPKPYPLFSNLGFTLIELLIILTLITLLFSLGMARYNRFNRRQILVRAKDELISNLRLVQSKSLTAEKPSDCGDAPLTGHKLKFTDNKNYKIVAVCGKEVDIKTNLTLAAGVTKQSGPNEIFFKILSQGTDIAGEAQIVLSGFGETQIITINSAGEIR